MQNCIAILGWGSLIWDLDNLSPHVHPGWMMDHGPRLPMEFTRVSPKRKMGLAVCLDPDSGVPCPTHAIRSVRQDVTDAQEDLAKRERAPIEGIGYVCLASDTAAGRDAISGIVSRWCASTGWKGAVWTDLQTNYMASRGEAFSIPSAYAYLRGLRGESLDEAVRYIQNAPAATDTPLRRHLVEDPWWMAQAKRLADLENGGPDRR